MDREPSPPEEARSRIFEEKVGRELADLGALALYRYDVLTPVGRAALAGYLRELAGHIESFDPTREGGWYTS